MATSTAGNRLYYAPSATTADTQLLKQAQTQIESLRNELVESQLELHQLKKKYDEVVTIKATAFASTSQSEQQQQKPEKPVPAADGSTSIKYPVLDSKSSDHSAYRQEIKALQLKLSHAQDDARNWREKCESMQREYRMAAVERDSIKTSSRDAAERTSRIETQRLAEIERLCEQVAALETELTIERSKNRHASAVMRARTESEKQDDDDDAHQRQIGSHAADNISGQYDHSSSVTSTPCFRQVAASQVSPPSRLMQLVSSPSLPRSPSRNSTFTSNQGQQQQQPQQLQQPQGTTTTDSQQLFRLQTENDALKLRIKNTESKLQQCQQTCAEQSKQIREQHDAIRRHTYETIGESGKQSNGANNNINKESLDDHQLLQTSINNNNVMLVVSDLRRELADAQADARRFKQAHQELQRVHYLLDSNNYKLKLANERLLSDAVNLEQQLLQSRHSRDLLKMHVDALLAARKQQNTHTIQPAMETLSSICEYEASFTLTALQHSVGVARLELEQLRMMNSLLYDRCHELEHQLGIAVQERAKMHEELEVSFARKNYGVRQNDDEQRRQREAVVQSPSPPGPPRDDDGWIALPLIKAHQEIQTKLEKQIQSINEKYVRVHIQCDVNASASCSRLYELVLLNQFSLLEQSRLVKAELFDACAFSVHENVKSAKMASELAGKSTRLEKENEKLKQDVTAYKKQLADEGLLLIGGSSSPSYSMRRSNASTLQPHDGKRNDPTDASASDSAGSGTTRLVLRQIHRSVLDAFRVLIDVVSQLDQDDKQRRRRETQEADFSASSISRRPLLVTVLADDDDDDENSNEDEVQGNRRVDQEGNHLRRLSSKINNDFVDLLTNISSSKHDSSHIATVTVTTVHNAIASLQDEWKKLVDRSTTDNELLRLQNQETEERQKLTQQRCNGTCQMFSSSMNIVAFMTTRSSSAEATPRPFHNYGQHGSAQSIGYDPSSINARSVNSDAIIYRGSPRTRTSPRPNSATSLYQFLNSTASPSRDNRRNVTSSRSFLQEQQQQQKQQHPLRSTNQDLNHQPPKHVLEHEVDDDYYGTNEQDHKKRKLSDDESDKHQQQSEQQRQPSTDSQQRHRDLRRPQQQRQQQQQQHLTGVFSSVAHTTAISFTYSILQLKKEFSTILLDSYGDILAEYSAMKRDSTYVLDVVPMRRERDAALSELSDANRAAFEVLDSRKDLQAEIAKMSATLDNERELRNIELAKVRNLEQELRGFKERVLRMEGEATDLRFALHQRHKSDNEKESVIVSHLSEQQRNLMHRAQTLEKDKMNLELRLADLQAGQLGLAKRTKAAEHDADEAREQFDKKVVEHEMAVTRINRLRQECDATAARAENLKALLDQECVKVDQATREAEQWRATAQDLQRRIEVDENLMRNIMGGTTPGWLGGGRTSTSLSLPSTMMNTNNNNNRGGDLNQSPSSSSSFDRHQRHSTRKNQHQNEGFNTDVDHHYYDCYDSNDETDHRQFQQVPHHQEQPQQQQQTQRVRQSSSESLLLQSSSSIPPMSIEQAALLNTERALVDTQLQRARLEARMDAARKEGAKSTADLRRVWERKDRDLTMRELLVTEQQERLDTFCEAMQDRMSGATHSERAHRLKCNLLSQVNDELRRMCGMFVRRVKRESAVLRSWETKQMARFDGVEFPLKKDGATQTGEKVKVDAMSGLTASARFAAERLEREQLLKASSLPFGKHVDATSSTASRIRMHKGGRAFWGLIVEAVEKLGETYLFGGRILALHVVIGIAMIVLSFVTGLFSRSC